MPKNLSENGMFPRSNSRKGESFKTLHADTGRNRWIENNLQEIAGCHRPVCSKKDITKCNDRPWTLEGNTKSRPADTYGTLVFENTVAVSAFEPEFQAGSQRQSPEKPFVRISSACAAPDVVDMLVAQWGLSMPRMVVSITGGAASFDLPTNLEDKIKTGLRKTAESSSAWIISAGTNTGVMQLVGRAVQEASPHKQPGPTIAVAPWSAIQGKHLLTGARGKKVNYGDPNAYNPSYCALDRNHTHFILVDDGTVDQFGGEIQFRSDLEATIDSETSVGEFNIEFDISSVLVCIQGGPNTIKTCLASVRKGRPLVTVSGSGGAADIIAYAYTMQHGHTSNSMMGLAKMVKQFFEKTIRSQSDEDARNFVTTLVSEVVEVTRHRDLVLVYDFSTDDFCLDHAILNAVFRQDRKTMARHLVSSEVVDSFRVRTLELALLWDRIDIARLENKQYRLLDSVAWNLSASNVMPGRSRLLQNSKVQMLKYGIDESRVDFVKLFFETMSIDDASHFLNLKRVETRGRRGHKRQQMASSFFAKRRENRSIFFSLLSEDFEDIRIPPHLRRSDRRLIGQWVTGTAKEDHVHFHLFQELGKLGHNIVKATNASDTEDSDTDVEDAYNHLQGKQVRYADAFRSGDDLVQFLIGNDYMICRRTAFNVNAPECEFTESFYRELASYLHHKDLLRRLNKGVQIPDSEKVLFEALSAEVQSVLLRHAQGVLQTVQESFVIWLPDMLELLYVDASFNPRSQALFKATFQGDFARHCVQRVIAKALGNEYKCNLHVFNNLSPYFHLTIWATMTQDYELADYFLQLSPEDSLVTALIAASVVEHLANTDEQLVTPEVSVKFSDMKQAFINFVLDVLQLCEHRNSARTEALLKATTYEAGLIPTWRLALNLRAGEVMAFPAVQRVVQEEWYGKIHYSNAPWKFVAAVVFPPYLLLHAPFERYHAHSSSRRKKFAHRFKYACAIRMDIPERDDKDQPRPYVDIAFDRMRAVYNSPSMAFWLEAFVFLVFLILFTASTVAPPVALADIFETDHGILSLTVSLWMITLIVDEIRQLLQTGRGRWLDDMFNRMDLAIYLLYITSVLLRAGSTEMVMRGHAAQAFVALMLWIRTSRFYAVNSSIGPKLVMVSEMLSDIGVFVALVLLALVGYGVAAYSLIFPFRTWDEETTVDILYRPYFQMYGELFLEEVQAQAGCRENFAGCDSDNGWLALLLLVVFMLVANILLVNLLIAMMSSTYERVEGEAKRVWALQSAELLDEFTQRWFFPTPFHIFRNIYLAGRWVHDRFFRDCCSNRINQDPAAEQGSIPLPYKPYGKLRKFLAEETDKYFQHRKRMLRGTLEERVSKLARNVHEVIDHLQDLEFTQNKHGADISTTLESVRQLVTPASVPKLDDSFLDLKYRSDRLHPSGSKIPTEFEEELHRSDASPRASMASPAPALFTASVHQDIGPAADPLPALGAN